MKKFLKLSLFSMLMLGVLTACGDAEPGPLTIGVWGGTEAEITARDAMIEAFTAETGIEVEIRTWADYQVNLQAELVGGTAPDIFYVEAFLFPQFVEDGVLANLDEFIASTPDFNQDDFYAPVLDAFTAPDGGVYGLPKDLSTLGLFYNERLLAEAGFSADDIPTEMADLPEFLRDLDASLPDGYTAGVISAELARHVFVLEANGTPIIDEEGFAVLTEDDQLEYLQMLVDAFDEGLIARPADLGDGWSGDAFGNENAAIMIEGNWAIRHLLQEFPNVEFGTKEIPTMNGNEGSMVFTVSYSINAASTNKDAAWEFVNFATGTDGMRIWTEGASLIPSRTSTAELMDLENHEFMAPFAAAADYATPWRRGTTLSIVMAEYNNMLPAALSGEMTLLEAMQEAERSANERIETHMQ